jgi:hypothetical protein
VAGQNQQKEQPWAREERGVAARGAGIAEVAAMATGIVGRAVPSRNTRRNASSARRSAKRSAARNGSKSARSDARIAVTAPAKARSEREVLRLVAYTRRREDGAANLDAKTGDGPGPSRGPRS